MQILLHSLKILRIIIPVISGAHAWFYCIDSAYARTITQGQWLPGMPSVGTLVHIDLYSLPSKPLSITRALNLSCYPSNFVLLSVFLGENKRKKIDGKKKPWARWTIHARVTAVVPRSRESSHIRVFWNITLLYHKDKSSHIFEDIIKKNINNISVYLPVQSALASHHANYGCEFQRFSLKIIINK